MTLPERIQRLLVVGEPGEKLDGYGRWLLGPQERVLRDRAVLGVVPQAAELVPPSEAFDDLPLVQVVDGGELRVQPAAIGREQTISRGKHTVFDEEPTHVLDRPGLGQGVERGMVEGEAAVADPPQQRMDVGEADPSQPGTATTAATTGRRPTTSSLTRSSPRMRSGALSAPERTWSPTTARRSSTAAAAASRRMRRCAGR